MRVKYTACTMFTPFHMRSIYLLCNAYTILCAYHLPQTQCLHYFCGYHLPHAQCLHHFMYVPFTVCTMFTPFRVCINYRKPNNYTISCACYSKLAQFLHISCACHMFTPLHVHINYSIHLLQKHP